MINTNLEDVMNALESLSDEKLALNLLKEFNDASSKWGKLMMNQDEALEHKVWKQEADQAKEKLDKVLLKILA